MLYLTSCELQSFKCIFTSPRSAHDPEGGEEAIHFKGLSSCSRSHIMALLKMTSVQPQVIAYIAVQVRLLIPRLILLLPWLGYIDRLHCPALTRGLWWMRISTTKHSTTTSLTTSKHLVHQRKQPKSRTSYSGGTGQYIMARIIKWFAWSEKNILQSCLWPSQCRRLSTTPSRDTFCGTFPQVVATCSDHLTPSCSTTTFVDGCTRHLIKFIYIREAVCKPQGYKWWE